MPKIPVSEIYTGLGRTIRSALEGAGTEALRGGKLLARQNTLDDIYRSMKFAAPNEYSPGIRKIPVRESAPPVEGVVSKERIPHFIEHRHSGPNRIVGAFGDSRNSDFDYYHSQPEFGYIKNDLLKDPNASTYTLETMGGLGAPGAGGQMYSDLIYNADNLVDELGHPLIKMPTVYTGDNVRAQFSAANRVAANRIVGGEATPYPNNYIWSNQLGRSRIAVPAHMQESLGGLKQVGGLPRVADPTGGDSGFYDAMYQLNRGSPEQQNRALGSAMFTGDMYANETVPGLAGTNTEGALAARQDAAKAMSARTPMQQQRISSPNEAARAKEHEFVVNALARGETPDVDRLSEVYQKYPFKRGGLARYSCI